jgi:hypothetical protein
MTRLLTRALPPLALLLILACGGQQSGSQTAAESIEPVQIEVTYYYLPG